MNVTQYTFQSPYSSPVQVGRPDPSSQKADSTGQVSSKLPSSTNTSLVDAQNFQATQIGEVTPTLDSGNTIDIYA